MSRGLVALAAVGLLAAGCSDEPPPDWLQEVADDQVVAPSTTAPPPTSTTTTTTTVPTAAAVELEQGTCLDDVGLEGGADLERATTVPCRGPHEAEVYAVIDLEEGPGAGFPGGGNLTRRANEACQERFERFVGISFTRSALDIVTLRPTRESWDEGDRSVVCALADLDGGPLQGTARGSEQ